MHICKKLMCILPCLTKKSEIRRFADDTVSTIAAHQITGVDGFNHIILLYRCQYHIVMLNEISQPTTHLDFITKYRQTFAQNRFHYLSRHPSVVTTFGSTQDARIAHALLAARDANSALAVEARHGEVLHDPGKVARLDTFFARFLAAWNRRGARAAWHTALEPPRHIWTAPREPAFSLLLQGNLQRTSCAEAMPFLEIRASGILGDLLRQRPAL